MRHTFPEGDPRLLFDQYGWQLSIPGYLNKIANVIRMIALFRLVFLGK
ncbi:hypothetical protein [Arcticibacter sp. MXS-1]